tara:strand:- start:132 stop:401 length:270 start_codon:yes stop_codon:yes gene_type:complete
MSGHTEQLGMLLGRDYVLSLPDASLPPGYSIRQYQAGDGPQWVELLLHGDFSKWSMGRFEGYIEGPECKEGFYVVINDSGIVAEIFAFV